MHTYPSSTKLGAWVTDLCFQIRQIKSQVYEETPTVFWLSGFIVLSSFLTAVPRIAAKRKSVTIQKLPSRSITTGAYLSYAYYAL